jgi:hypothetical protein
MKENELHWKENQGIQITGTEDSQENTAAAQKQVLKIWENYITELYNQGNQPKNRRESGCRTERPSYFAQWQKRLSSK